MLEKRFKFIVSMCVVLVIVLMGVMICDMANATGPCQDKNKAIVAFFNQCVMVVQLRTIQANAARGDGKDTIYQEETKDYCACLAQNYVVERVANYNCYVSADNVDKVIEHDQKQRTCSAYQTF